LTVWVPIGDIALARTTGAVPMVDLSHKPAPHAASAAPRSDRAPAEPGTVDHVADDGSAHALDALMERYARGDDATFDDLYRRGAPRVRRFLLRLCGDEALADDLAQETFLRVCLARGSFAAHAAALPWMFAIARNTFIDWTRLSRVRREVAVAGAAAGAIEPEAPRDTRGDDALAAREMLVVVRTTLARMPILLREAFVLIRFEGLSVSEASQVLGATEGAVKVRAFRAYELLRAALEIEPREGK
jgi:RNA polymerase sigma-70 factor (ECF subfamily)